MNSIEAVVNFLEKSNINQTENFWYSVARDQSNARIANWVRLFQSQGESLNSSIVLGSILGELTNNSFDHNFGKWKDLSG